MSLKTHLSHLLPVAQAVSIIGEEAVTRMVSSLLRMQLPTVSEDKIVEETSNLLAAMLYTSNRGGETTSAALLDSDIPPSIRSSWKQLQSRPLLLDKASLIRFMVPSSAQPHVGPGGHMGLFDCLVYALQNKPGVSSPKNGALPSMSMVAIPDVIIFLAVCHNYWTLQNEKEGEDAILSVPNDHPAILAMSQWMFLLYDAYQKKGLVVRDTVHRFLSDIHGEDSYKTPNAKKVLDKVFRQSTQLTNREFVLAISGTMIFSPQPSHLLLDWMAGMAQAIQPRLPPAESTQEFLQTIEQQSRWLPQILDQYSLAEYRLYEIKRRFHSLVETATTVIQGDPMTSDSVVSDNSQSPAASQAPKHVISSAAFKQAVSKVSSDQGHGGFFPEHLAERIFFGVLKVTPDSKEKAEPFWDLTHVLTFGGMCVRAPDEASLVKWIVQYMLPSSKALAGLRSKPELTTAHVGEFLQMLCEHMWFRILADKPLLEEIDHDIEDDAPQEGQVVKMEAALKLGLLPSDIPKSTNVSLKVLVDHFMKQVESSDTVTLDKLLKWQLDDKDGNQIKLGPFLTELRLVASVMFGIPPKLASMEKHLIGEIHQRHKIKYPQTAASRRGPRGTVWYMIDDTWYQSWKSLVERASFTSKDGEDLRDQDSNASSPRNVGKISNRDLLRDGGSLALRVDIKWRNDYEIIPPLAWSGLQAWYDGGPPISRSVVPYRASAASTPTNRAGRTQMKTENEIELYPFFVTMFMCDSASKGDARPFQQGVPVSRVNPIRVLLVQLCKGLDVDPDRGRLWVMESSTSTQELETSTGRDDWLLDLDSNIVEQRKSRGSGDQSGTSSIQLLLELKDNKSDLWPRGEDGKTWTFSKTDTHRLDTGDGIVGLYNMGNTCYMNSSIQCLSHTPIFRDYFNSKCYLKDINTTNPLGYQGRLAQVSAVLINSLWKQFSQQMGHQQKRVTAPGTYAPVSAPSLTPKTFKESLGKFNELFAGNEQHDAQELLAFLLGGLSEDLNRIVEKPYIQAPDSDGRPDSELADIWWSNHLKREMSIIVALFTGQYKSLLKCRTCSYESARFEPFTFLQVPLPEDDTIPVNLILYPAQLGKDVMKYAVRVHSNGTLYDVLLALSEILHTDELGKSKPSANDEEKKRLVKCYADTAKNLAVVDMRDGFIFKIAPNAWRLPDLQNKDTGELPLLHIYQLDALPEGSSVKVDSTEDEEGDSEDSKEDSEADIAFLALAQRKTETSTKEVLHPLKHSVFGTPLLLRIVQIESRTGRQIYDMVAQRLQNFVPPQALKFLESPEAAESNEAAAVSSSENEKSEYTKFEIRQRLTKTLTDMEEVAAGPVPRYGFRLRLATRDGRRCALCPWYDSCIGCLIPDDDALTVVMNGDSIVIDWHFAVDVETNGFGTRGKKSDGLAQQTQQQRNRPTVAIKSHSSCTVGKKYGQSGTITLEDCLDAFAKEEKIPEAYCSKCKDFRVQTKRMSLWRLPPVVIIHLKRFQFTQHMRRKLRDFVDFPVEGLDLSRIMATDTLGSEKEPEKESNSSEETESQPKSSETAENGDAEMQEADAAIDATTMNQDSGRNEMLYDLYGVVHHQGALSGGHYVASLKSDDGQWRLFNDAQVYEIHSRDVVDSSAYILFYIRRDVKDLKLEDFWNTSPARDGEGLTEEEMDQLIRERSDRCVIS